MKTSIFTKILLMCILPIGVVLVMIISNINNFISDALKQNEVTSVINYANETVSRLDSKSEMVSISLDFVSDFFANLSGREEMINHSLNYFEQALPQLPCSSAWIILEAEQAGDNPYFLYFTNGKNVNSENADLQKKMCEARYIYPSTEKDFYVSEIMEDGTYFISKPLVKNGVKIGMIGFDIWSGSELLKTEAKAVYEKSDLLLLSKEGRIHYCNDSKLIGKNIVDLFPEINLSLNEQYFFCKTSSLETNNSIVYRMPISQYDGQFQADLLISTSSGSIQKIGSEMRTGISVMSFLGLLICVIIIFFSTRNIIRPLRQIISTADTISDGNLEVGFGTEYDEIKNTKNEVILLSKSLSKMLQQLNQYQNMKIESISLEHEKNLAVEASNAKSSFLANMSHEIRTPMNAIIGMAEMILRCDADAKVMEYTTYIKNAGKSLLTIINDILDFSKIEAGKMEIIAVQYQLPSLLNDIVNMAQVRILDKQIKFIVDADSNLPYELFGDEIRIKQILTNYINNAIKFTKEGAVTLCIYGENKEDGFSLHVKVKDTGVGIKSEDLEKLFSSFSQVDTRKNRAIEGTGLGLAICKRLTELMGGSVCVESEYGKGAVFSAIIPQTVINAVPIGELWDQNNTQNAEIFKIDFTAPKANILLVDDNEVNLLVAQGLLFPYNMKITTATSAAKCLEFMKHNSYDIIFMDHMMPVMDGMEATSIIRKTNMQVPVIALTANAINGVKEIYLENGFNDYLSKPIEVSGMDRILRTYLPKEYIEFNFEGKQLEVDSNLSNEIMRSIWMDAKRKIPLLKELYANKRWKDYEIETHALKSVAAAAGQMDLSELARVHEMSAKENNEEKITESFEELIETYQLFVDSIQLIEEKETEDQRVLPAEEIENMFQAIKECAEQFDIDGVKKEIEILKTVRLSETEKEIFVKITEAAELLDYDEINNITAYFDTCI